MAAMLKVQKDNKKLKQETMKSNHVKKVNQESNHV